MGKQRKQQVRIHWKLLVANLHTGGSGYMVALLECDRDEVRQPPECLSSPLKDHTAYPLSLGKGLEKVP